VGDAVRETVREAVRDTVGSKFSQRTCGGSRAASSISTQSFSTRCQRRPVATYTTTRSGVARSLSHSGRRGGWRLERARRAGHVGARTSSMALCGRRITIRGSAALLGMVSSRSSGSLNLQLAPPPVSPPPTTPRKGSSTCPAGSGGMVPAKRLDHQPISPSSRGLWSGIEN
jgi:hypothetical protein